MATGQVQPEQVLGLTFTTKAAGELSSRVRAAVQRLSDRVAGRSLEEVGEPTVATYHAFAGRLIAEHGLRIGVEPRRAPAHRGRVGTSSRTASSRALRATSSTLGYAVVLDRRETCARSTPSSPSTASSPRPCGPTTAT